MKNVSPAMRLELRKEITTLCRLWRITPIDGSTLYFTDLDRDLVYGGNTYVSTNTFQASAVQTTINSAASNLEVTILLDDASILNYMGIQRGSVSSAACELELVSYTNLAAGGIMLFTGNIGDITEPTVDGAILSMMGNLGRVSAQIGEVYTPFCRADFGDSRCTFPVETVTFPFTITALGGSMAFASDDLDGKEINQFTLGSVKWLTGANTGSAQEVVGNSDTGDVRLFFRPPSPMQLGDTGEIVQGCAKTVSACVGYSNKPNYRGEPEVPGDSYTG